MLFKNVDAREGLLYRRGIVSRSSMETEVYPSVSRRSTDLNEGKSEFSLQRILQPAELMWRILATW